MVDALAVFAVATGLLGWALGAIVLAAGSGRDNRVLGAVLLLEGTVQITGPFDHPVSDAFFMIGLAALSWTYFLLIARLATPLARPLASTVGRRVVVAFLAAAVTLGVVLSVRAATLGVGPFEFAEGSPVFVLVVLAVPLPLVASMFYGLVASASAFRRAPRGTPARRKAAAFLLAFGVRDSVIGGVALVIYVLAPLLGWAWIAPYEWIGDLAPGVAQVVYLPLLAYGILRTQLFDIDLKVKWGAARGAVVAFVVVLALIAAKITEFYLSSALGLIFGGTVAGLTLFLAPRLNRIADKVADKAAPTVKPTEDYVEARKAEVYRAAVETAWEGGSITAKDRLILDKLREKLALSADEASRLESEAARAVSQRPAPV